MAVNNRYSESSFPPWANRVTRYFFWRKLKLTPRIGVIPFASQLCTKVTAPAIPSRSVRASAFISNSAARSTKDAAWAVPYLNEKPLATWR